MPASSAAHASVDVADLDASAAFYRALLGEPTMLRSDYARFELDDPPFVLSLVPAPPGPAAGRVNHLGLRLADVAALDGIAARLTAAGLAFERETEVECCYSRQTKLWLVDPDGTLWELYVRLGAVAFAGRSRHAPPPVATADRRGWTHRLGQPIPERIPAADASLAEVLLEGTINAKVPSSELNRLLAEALRCLEPGGALRVHGLVADQPVPAGAVLPGPAARVERIPVEAEPFAAVKRAGFADLRATALPDRPNLRAGAAELREILIAAERPRAPVGGRFVPVLYRGPFSRVEDDRGQVYPRGERVWIDVATRDALAAGPMAESFALFDVPAADAGGCC